MPILFGIFYVLAIFAPLVPTASFQNGRMRLDERERKRGMERERGRERTDQHVFCGMREKKIGAHTSFWEEGVRVCTDVIELAFVMGCEGLGY